MEVGKHAQRLARELPREARYLLREHVHSAGELDLLMLLHGDRARAWTVDEICTALRCPTGWAEPRLEALRRAGVFVRVGQGYACAPATRELENALSVLEEAQRMRWSELTALIAAPRRSRWRALTEGTSGA
jgi:hypothetical protein